MKNELKRIIKPIIITAAVIVLIAVLLTGFSALTYNLNVSRLNNGEDPLFIYRTDTVLDGGTKIYHGLGYHIIKWHQAYDKLYICGWDIGRGSERNTLDNGPSPEHTSSFHFE